ncbi:leucyl aminopeptidase [Guyparkeria halophila]|uniref:Probable cytosol aminopeptidase n=1 Tax=Guyparkeria halophila TaxID=47960 RepID=A0ABZ0YV20_9GAMM|nr:leucyl aminopeptidase [Guyparkeria halophila]WQH16015.1 leucyl aminopeptidase [Guyparkeria halophila]
MLEFSVKSGAPEKQRTACLIVGVFESRRLTAAAETIDRVSDGFVSAITRRGDMDGELGDTLLLHGVPNVQADRVMLVGLGKERELDTRGLVKATRAAVEALHHRGTAECVSHLSEIDVRGVSMEQVLRQSIVAIDDALYRFDELKTDRDLGPRRPLRKVTFILPTRRELMEAERYVREATAISNGMRMAKNLANMPANLLTPTTMAEHARKMTETHLHLSVEVLDASRMESLGMNALLAVAKGSSEPPKMIVMEHMGADADTPPIVLVGKGVTFDTGGISLKPGPDMDQMKFDMGGAAATIGVMSAVAEMQLPINVVGIVPTVENMPDGAALKPGDVIRSMSGQTIEVLNTDAEGRLILCDALTYAARYKPAAIVDIATLTGAVIVALGRHPSGLLSNHDPLAKELLRAGEAANDRAWQLPLWDEYQDQLKSNFADMANIGGREGGSITAAAFLSRFVKEHHWAHLDIAGTAWKVGDAKGATGRPVPLLAEFLMQRASQQQDGNGGGAA